MDKKDEELKKELSDLLNKIDVGELLKRCQEDDERYNGVFQKIKWPTLEGRLNQPLTTELEALEQLETMVPLSDYAKKKLARLRKKKI